jgi:hypothetical protein
MSRVAELIKRHDSLKEELVKVNGDLAQELGLTAVTPAPRKTEGEKRGRKPKAEGEAAASNKKSLKEVVKEVLARIPDGLELKGITAEVQTLIQKGEYTSKASNTSAVVAQAVNALKVEKAISHDKESKKYSLIKAE